MKTAAVTRVGSLKAKEAQIGLVDFPEQILGDEDVKIKVAYCAICGSDPHVAEGIFGTEVPIGLGHEVSGVITELGKKATRRGLKVGDRVAGNFIKFCGTCDSCLNGNQQFCENLQEYNRPGMAESIVWHESQVHKLPDHISLKKGCLLEPTAIAVRIMDKTKMKVGKTVAVCGGGPIGMLTLQAVKLYGATSLTLIEPISERRQLAKEFGADHTIDPLKEDVVEAAMSITGGKGFDVVIDASGSVHAVENLLKITTRGGNLLYAAMYPGKYEMPLNLFQYLYFNEITISGVFVAPYAFPRALNLLPRLNLDKFTEKVFPLDDVSAAFDAQMSGEYYKILIHCNNDLD